METIIKHFIKTKAHHDPKDWTTARPTQLVKVLQTHLHTPVECNVDPLLLGQGALWWSATPEHTYLGAHTAKLSEITNTMTIDGFH